MHYVMGDIHNEADKLQNVLKKINITKDDELIVLGDLFDRGGANPDPVGVYFTLSGLQGKVTWIRGNHDEWLAKYIYDFFSKSERKQKKMLPYSYNTFDLMVNRLTRVDMLNLADIIMKLPVQKDIVIDNHVPHGDGVIDTKYGNIGAVSSIVCSYIAQSLVIEIVNLYIENDLVPPIYMSANISGGDEHNKNIYEEYKKRVKSLY